MQIEIVVGDVAVLAAANRVGQLAQGVQIDLGREQELAVGRRERARPLQLFCESRRTSKFQHQFSVVSFQLSGPAMNLKTDN